MFKIGDIVKTPNGQGKIVDKERVWHNDRWGVKLDVNPFWYPIAYYFPKELELKDEKD